jgi:hypothetical protein
MIVGGGKIDFFLSQQINNHINHRLRIPGRGCVGVRVGEKAAGAPDVLGGGGQAREAVAG